MCYVQWNTVLMIVKDMLLCNETLLYWHWKSCYVPWNTVLSTVKDIFLFFFIFYFFLCETLFYQQWKKFYVCSENLFYQQWWTCYVQWNIVLLTVKYMLCSVKHCSIDSKNYVLCSEWHVLCGETLFCWQWKTCYVHWNTVLSTVKDIISAVTHSSVDSERPVMCRETLFYLHRTTSMFYETLFYRQ